GLAGRQLLAVVLDSMDDLGDDGGGRQPWWARSPRLCRSRDLVSRERVTARKGPTRDRGGRCTRCPQASSTRARRARRGGGSSRDSASAGGASGIEVRGCSGT